MPSKLKSYIVHSYGRDQIYVERVYSWQIDEYLKFGNEYYYKYYTLHEFLDVRNRHPHIDRNKITDHFLYYANNSIYMWIQAKDWFDAVKIFKEEISGKRNDYEQCFISKFKPYKTYKEIKTYKKIETHE